MSRVSPPWCRMAALLAGLTFILCYSPSVRADDQQDQQGPRVEVAFVLDTTGSMGDMLDGAKRKIWHIANRIASGRPTPYLRIALVAYKDRPFKNVSDEYVTKVIDFNDDLDEVHENLKGFTAKGGGDRPESVNQALHEAVHKLSWHSKKDTLKLIFLVGDAAPHMDYADELKKNDKGKVLEDRQYTGTCPIAVRRGISIITIQCGTDTDCTYHWEKIARMASGQYVKVPQSGGVAKDVGTTYDKELVEINEKLAKLTIFYGNPAARAKAEAKKANAKKLDPFAGADRAAFNAKTNRFSPFDLSSAVKSGKVKLKDIPDEDLPEVLRKVPKKDREDYLNKLAKERDGLIKRALDLDRLRDAELAKDGKAREGFDHKIIEILREEANKYGIKY